MDNSKELFQEYWSDSYNILSGYIRNFIFNQQEFDDIIQDVTLIALKKFESFDHSKKFSTWIIGIAKYEILAKRRKYSKNPLIYDDDVFSTISDTYEDMIPELDDRMTALTACLQEISKEDKEILFQKYSKTKKIKEIAAIMGIQAVTLRVRIHRLRDALKYCVEKKMNSSDGV